MSTTSLTTSTFADDPFPSRRFTVDEYRRMGETGVLTEDDRVELLEGLVVTKMIHNPPHDSSVHLTDDALRQRLPAGWHTRIQSSVTTDDSEPEPDVAVVRGSARDYSARHPGPHDIGLVIEVADASLRSDRNKRRLYARARIICYWIVNLVDLQVEVYSDPSGPHESPRYREEAIYRADQSLPLVLDGKEIGQIPVRDLLP